jgi:hypothetical protein
VAVVVGEGALDGEVGALVDEVVPELFELDEHDAASRANPPSTTMADQPRAGCARPAARRRVGPRWDLEVEVGERGMW